MGKPIIILNAPPQTGKDTLAKAFIDDPRVTRASFKDPMFLIVATTLGMNVNEFLGQYEVEGWKDTHYVAPGRTVRDLMIHQSENYIKPFFGKSYFGDYLCKSIKDTEDWYDKEYAWIITDGGFFEEVVPLFKEFGERVVIIQLEREGHRDFGKDSRSWLTFDDIETYRFDTTEGNLEVISKIKELIA